MLKIYNRKKKAWNKRKLLLSNKDRPFDGYNFKNFFQ